MRLTSFARPVAAFALAATLLARSAHADPVVLTGPAIQFNAPTGWTGSSPGPQLAHFTRGAISVDVLVPTVDAQHTAASLVRQVQTDPPLRARWRGRPTLRVVREARGSMQHGTGTHDGHPASLLMVWAPMGDRLFLAIAYLPIGATGEDEGLVHELIDSVRPLSPAP